jgi:hypothetical protein
MFLTLFNISFAQVVYNDNIENRHTLIINDKPYISHTENSTVQRKCLNQALTELCLVYHNDQWFEFTTNENTEYYFNIRNQDCHDVRGVQAVMIKGEPCVPESYELITCISNGHQDDVYTTLNLKANQTYLLIIDGYLHDNCYFDIDISTTPPDFALLEDEGTDFDTLTSSESLVQFHWLMDTSLAEEVQQYQILRRFDREKKSKIIWSSPNLRNAMGRPFIEYEYQDTIESYPEGVFEYSVLSINQDSTQNLIQKLKYMYEAISKERNPADDIIIYTLPKSKRGNLFYLSLYEASTDLLLEKKSLQYDKLFDTIKLNISAYRDKGMTQFKLKVENVESEEVNIKLYKKPLVFPEKDSGKIW